MNESVAYDFGQSSIHHLNFISHTFQNVIEEINIDFASKYATRVDAAQTGLDNLIEAYRNLQ